MYLCFISQAKRLAIWLVTSIAANKWLELHLFSNKCLPGFRTLVAAWIISDSSKLKFDRVTNFKKKRNSWENLTYTIES